MDDVLGMGGKYMFSKYKQAAKQFCATKWHHTWTRWTQQRAWKMSKNCHIFRFLQGSYPNSDVERLQTQCFKSVWVATALHQVGEKTYDGKWCNPTTGFDLPSQLWSSHCSTQHSPRRGRLAKKYNIWAHWFIQSGGSLDAWGFALQDSLFPTAVSFLPDSTNFAWKLEMQQVPRKTLPYNVVQWFASRSLELCHGMGHHTALLAKFYHRPSKPLEKTKHQTKVPQFCPNITPSSYAAAPHPTCRQGRSCSTQCCHSVIPFLSPVTCPIDPNNLVTQSKE